MEQCNRRNEISENDNLPLKLDCMKMEYTALRSEILSFMQLQVALVTIWMTVMGVIFGYLFSNENLEQGLVELIISLIFPGVSVFLGIIWIDFSMRILKATCYIRKIEVKMCSFFRDKELVNWEGYVQQDSEIKIIVPVNQISSYITMGVMLGMPLFISPILSWKWGIICNPWVWIYYSSCLLCAMFFGFIEVKQIKKYEELTRNVMQSE